MEQTIPAFIFIDDDPVSNSVGRRVIKKMLPEAEVKIFNEPEAGLEFIKLTYTSPDSNRAILFLDINMPTLTGWDVLEKLEEHADMIKQNIKICMLSSSIDPRDRQRATDNPLVSACFEKSLTKSHVSSVLYDPVEK